MLITYNDDQQGYPHPDHLRVHDVSVLAFHRAGDPAWYPEAGEPWTPLKLYYTVWSRSRLLAVHEALLRLRGESPFDEKWFERPGMDERITTRVDVREYLWARSGALRAHATQVNPAEAFWFGLSDEELAEVYPYEDWILAESRVGSPPPGHARRRSVRRSAGAGQLVTTVQYRVAVGKRDEIVVGPDDAELVVTIAQADIGLDPTVAYMQGKLKSTGPTGPCSSCSSRASSVRRSPHSACIRARSSR